MLNKLDTPTGFEGWFLPRLFARDFGSCTVCSAAVKSRVTPLMNITSPARRGGEGIPATKALCRKILGYRQVFQKSCTTAPARDFARVLHEVVESLVRTISDVTLDLPQHCKPCSYKSRANLRAQKPHPPHPNYRPGVTRSWTGAAPWSVPCFLEQGLRS